MSFKADYEDGHPFEYGGNVSKIEHMQKEQLTIVIPAYNEETRLPPTIKKVLQWADQTTVFDIELIIVDDGSGDRTCDVVREFASKDSRVRLIQETHVGAMHAILKGFQVARYPLVGNMDADIAVHPQGML